MTENTTPSPAVLFALEKRLKGAIAEAEARIIEALKAPRQRTLEDAKTPDTPPKAPTSTERKRCRSVPVEDYCLCAQITREESAAHNIPAHWGIHLGFGVPVYRRYAPGAGTFSENWFFAVPQGGAKWRPSQVTKPKLSTRYSIAKGRPSMTLEEYRDALGWDSAMAEGV